MTKANKKNKDLNPRTASKLAQNKEYVDSIAFHLSNSFLVNAMKMDHNGDGIPDPFKFVIKFIDLTAITINEVNINGIVAEKSNYSREDGILICTMKAFVSRLSFPMYIKASGAGFEGEFTMTCDAKKVFNDPQKIVISSNGKGGYKNMKVKMP